MKSSIHNIQQVLLFRGVAFAIVALGILPLFTEMEDLYRIGLFLGALVMLISLWLIIQPGYMAFETSQGKVLISTDKEDTAEFFLVLPMAEVAGYEIERSFGGLRRNLFIYRKTPKGFLRSKAIPMSLFSRTQTTKMCAQLDAMVETNGFGHLKL